MGTNYYATFIVQREDIYGKEYHTRETLHIGKTSGGWVFNWHGYMPDEPIIEDLPVLQITTVEDWQRVLAVAEKITNEYGAEYTYQEFMDMALNWNTGRNHAVEYPVGNWLARYGQYVYSFSSGDWC